jgi:hypothetical protein
VIVAIFVEQEHRNITFIIDNGNTRNYRNMIILARITRDMACRKHALVGLDIIIVESLLFIDFLYLYAIFQYDFGDSELISLTIEFLVLILSILMIVIG